MVWSYGTPHNFYENFIDVMVNIDGSDGTADAPCVGVLVLPSAGRGWFYTGGEPGSNPANNPDPCRSRLAGDSGGSVPPFIDGTDVIAGKPAPTEDCVGLGG